MEQPWFPPNASPFPQSAWRLPDGDAAVKLARLSLIRTFVFTHYPTQNRYALLLEML
jgi:hypothetical protein